MSKLDDTAKFFTENPWVWIDGRRLAQIGGAYAWRSRVADCRTKRGMVIENRLRNARAANGNAFVVSEYKYVPNVGEDGTIQ